MWATPHAADWWNRQRVCYRCLNSAGQARARLRGRALTDIQIAARVRADYLAAVNAPGVNAVNVAWTTEVKPAAAPRGVTLSKRSTATVMTGVAYRDLAVNNDRETGDLPWGEWAAGMYPWIITHKGRDYARLYTVDGTIRTTYYVDGEAVSWDAFAEHLTPSQRERKRPHGGTITVTLANLAVTR